MYEECTEVPQIIYADRETILPSKSGTTIVGWVLCMQLPHPSPSPRRVTSRKIERRKVSVFLVVVVAVEEDSGTNRTRVRGLDSFRDHDGAGDSESIVLERGDVWLRGGA